VTILELPQKISAEFEKAKAEYFAAKFDEDISPARFDRLEGKYIAWSAAFELSYAAVHGGKS
jgi:hypothetical protein